MISAGGVLVSTAAMVIILSAFNGFEGVVEKLYTSFDSDFKVELKEGKSFEIANVPLEEIRKIPGVRNMTKVIEEIALVKHEDRWITCTMKGVQEEFLLMSGLDSMMIEGYLDLGDGNGDLAVVGYGIQSRLGVTADPRFIDLVSVHGLVRTKKITKNTQAFNKKSIPIGGVFAINPEFDEKYFIVPLRFASELLDYDKEITGVEINCNEDVDLDDMKDVLVEMFGEQFQVKSYFEQNALLYQTHQSEKWMTFVILAFILVLSSFTLIASLTMLVIDKKNDIHTLASMGASRGQIRQIFFLEGMLINLVGAVAGLLIGYFICWIQSTFHVVELKGAIVPYYPVEMQFGDFLLILTTLLCIGVLATYFPVRYLIKRHFTQGN
ncbi:MAG: ABC transporter permease [Flavobacteriales bacterium]|nr:ABC transporter permease [Flavobacteriales bacterium]